MTGLQKKAYKAQSVALVLLCMGFIAFILDWDNGGTLLLLMGIVCVVKAMMYRERWELDQEYYGRTWVQNGAKEGQQSGNYRKYPGK